MIWSQEEANKGVAADVRSMAAIVAVANTLDPNLQFTSDCPSQHQNGKLPILDIQVWVEDGKVCHTLYRKEFTAQEMPRAPGRPEYWEPEVQHDKTLLQPAP